MVLEPLMILEPVDGMPARSGPAEPGRVRKKRQASTSKKRGNSLPSGAAQAAYLTTKGFGLLENVQGGESPEQAFHDAEISENTSADIMGDALPHEDRLAGTQDDAAAPALAVQDNVTGPVLDPKNSARQYYHDAYTYTATTVKREIWRPGDDDGDRTSEYYNPRGQPPPFEKRWRLYQSSIGNGPIKKDVNVPPKYVLLDDRSAYDALTSDIPRKHLGDWWEHDFGEAGKPRHRRPHRGRGAIADLQAEGQDQYHYAKKGGNGERYYFTGEKDYKPIVYHCSEPDATERKAGPKRKVFQPPDGTALPKKLRHNQFTRPDLLVKNGAPSLSRRPQRAPKINALLKRQPSPELPFNEAKMYGRQPAHGGKETIVHPGYGDDVHSIFKQGNGTDIWVAKDSPEEQLGYPQNKRYDALTLAKVNEGRSFDMDEFPFHRHSTDISLSASRALGVTHKELRADQDSFLSQLDEHESINNFEDDIPTAVTERGHDHGSYAANLEVDLAEAKKAIEERKTELDVLRKAHDEDQEAIKALKAEVDMLRGVEEVEDEVDDFDGFRAFEAQNQLLEGIEAAEDKDGSDGGEGEETL